MNSLGVRDEVYRRLLLARNLHIAGTSACAARNDQMAFTKGVFLLHDAAEAALGAVADHLNAQLKGNVFLLDYYELIERADPQKRPVPYKTQMRNLNTIRVAAKHHGILPDVKSNAHIPAIVHALLEELAQVYLGFSFSSVSLKELIRNDDVRQLINGAERQIEQADFEGALVTLAYAMFHICDTKAIPLFSGLFERPRGKYEFPQIYSTEHTLRLIERGVDPQTYIRFKNLTAKIGRVRESGGLVHSWEKIYGHPENWTEANSRFCLDFCIDTALKFQRDENEADRLIPYYEVYEDVVEPKGEEVHIWSTPKDWPDSAAPIATRRIVLSLKKGESIVGLVFDIGESDQLHVVSESIPSDSDRAGMGYVSRDEVQVSRRKMEF